MNPLFHIIHRSSAKDPALFASVIYSQQNLAVFCHHSKQRTDPHPEYSARTPGNDGSGDPDNMEARAAAYYWAHLFPDIPSFTRRREGEPPNHLLNYGYAILRAIIARNLVASGLLPTLGIHHHNRYNAYCLADDVMEPYRPYVDQLVIQVMQAFDDISELTRELKAELLRIPVLDVVVDGKRSPLMVAAGLTTASLARCYAGEARQLAYPQFS